MPFDRVTGCMLHVEGEHRAIHVSLGGCVTPTWTMRREQSYVMTKAKSVGTGDEASSRCIHCQ
jgi:hypothetical protein